MRNWMILAALTGWTGSDVKAWCTSAGHPGTVVLQTQVLEIQDDAAYTAGQDVWVPAGVKADSLIYAWLVWNNKPTGQGCKATFEGKINDFCGDRVSIEFQQPTAYNVGFAATDTPGNATAYPWRCTVELKFHVFDTTEFVLNPMWDPDDPTSPQYLPDPGFDLFTLVELRVTGQRYVNPGGVPSVPPGVSREGTCPEPQPDDAFPAYMLTGPGCPGPTAAGLRTFNSGGSAGAGVSRTLIARPVTAGTSRVRQAALVQRSSAASIRAAAQAKLAATMSALAARTQAQNGRPRIAAQ